MEEQKGYLGKLKFYNDPYYQRMHQWSLQEKYRQELELLLSFMQIESSDKVLDVGCNTGNVVKYIRDKYGCRVYGIDYPECWLEACQIDTGIRGDAHCLPFKGAGFDKVLMLHVIGHIPYPQKALEEIYRVLKPGGRLGIITPNALFVYLMKPLNYLQIIKHQPDPTVLRYYRLKSIKNIFNNAGYILERVFPSGKLPDLLHFALINRFGWAGSFRERLICVALKEV